MAFLQAADNKCTCLRISLVEDTMARCDSRDASQAALLTICLSCHVAIHRDRGRGRGIEGGGGKENKANLELFQNLVLQSG